MSDKCTTKSMDEFLRDLSTLQNKGIIWFLSHSLYESSRSECDLSVIPLSLSHKTYMVMYILIKDLTKMMMFLLQKEMMDDDYYIRSYKYQCWCDELLHVQMESY